MIRKFGHIDAPRDTVLELFRDTPGWDRWMPGVTSVRLVGEQAPGMVYEIRQHYYGVKVCQQLVCTDTAAGARHVQISGFFKRWEANWRFLEPPDREGTTVACDLDVELGLVGLVTSKRMVQRVLDQTFDLIITNANRVLVEVSKPRLSIPLPAADEPLLQLYETSSGLELVYAGQRYRLKAIG